jgi:hypothetical protein
VISNVGEDGFSSIFTKKKTQLKLILFLTAAVDRQAALAKKLNSFFFFHGHRPRSWPIPISEQCLPLPTFCTLHVSNILLPSEMIT